MTAAEVSNALIQAVNETCEGNEDISPEAAFRSVLKAIDRNGDDFGLHPVFFDLAQRGLDPVTADASRWQSESKTENSTASPGPSTTAGPSTYWGSRSLAEAEALTAEHIREALPGILQRTRANGRVAIVDPSVVNALLVDSPSQPDRDRQTRALRDALVGASDLLILPMVKGGNVSLLLYRPDVGTFHSLDPRGRPNPDHEALASIVASRLDLRRNTVPDTQVPGYLWLAARSLPDRYVTVGRITQQTSSQHGGLLALEAMEQAARNVVGGNDVLAGMDRLEATTQTTAPRMAPQRKGITGVSPDVLQATAKAATSFIDTDLPSLGILAPSEPGYLDFVHTAALNHLDKTAVEAALSGAPSQIDNDLFLIQIYNWAAGRVEKEAQRPLKWGTERLGQIDHLTARQIGDAFEGILNRAGTEGRVGIVKPEDVEHLLYPALTENQIELQRKILREAIGARGGVPMEVLLVPLTSSPLATPEIDPHRTTLVCDLRGARTAKFLHLDSMNYLKLNDEAAENVALTIAKRLDVVAERLPDADLASRFVRSVFRKSSYVKSAPMTQQEHTYETGFLLLEAMSKVSTNLVANRPLDEDITKLSRDRHAIAARMGSYTNPPIA
jgi:hypothetical protein